MPMSGHAVSELDGVMLARDACVSRRGPNGYGPPRSWSRDQLEQEWCVKPIAETVEAAEELGRFDPDMDVLALLQGMADKAQALVPDCLGMSIAWLDQGVAFTLVASDEELAVLDAVQYVAGGPCLEAAEQAQGLEATHEDLLDEDAWRLFSRATASKGVQSTLTIPLTRAGRMAGSANLYAASDNAFEGHHEELARIVGGEVAGVVRNADLTFSTRRAA